MLTCADSKFDEMLRFSFSTGPVRSAHRVCYAKRPLWAASRPLLHRAAPIVHGGQQSLTPAPTQQCVFGTNAACRVPASWRAASEQLSPRSAALKQMSWGQLSEHCKRAAESTVALSKTFRSSVPADLPEAMDAAACVDELERRASRLASLDSDSQRQEEGFAWMQCAAAFLGGKSSEVTVASLLARQAATAKEAPWWTLRKQVISNQYARASTASTALRFASHGSRDDSRTARQRMRDAAVIVVSQLYLARMAASQTQATYVASTAGRPAAAPPSLAHIAALLHVFCFIVPERGPLTQAAAEALVVCRETPFSAEDLAAADPAPGFAPDSPATSGAAASPPGPAYTGNMDGTAWAKAVAFLLGPIITWDRTTLQWVFATEVPDDDDPCSRYSAGGIRVIMHRTRAWERSQARARAAAEQAEAKARRESDFDSLGQMKSAQQFLMDLLLDDAPDPTLKKRDSTAKAPMDSAPQAQGSSGVGEMDGPIKFTLPLPSAGHRVASALDVVFAFHQMPREVLLMRPVYSPLATHLGLVVAGLQRGAVAELCQASSSSASATLDGGCATASAAASHNGRAAAVLGTQLASFCLHMLYNRRMRCSTLAMAFMPFLREEARLLGRETHELRAQLEVRLLGHETAAADTAPPLHASVDSDAAAGASVAGVTVGNSEVRLPLLAPPPAAAVEKMRNLFWRSQELTACCSPMISLNLVDGAFSTAFLRTTAVMEQLDQDMQAAGAPSVSLALQPLHFELPSSSPSQEGSSPVPGEDADLALQESTESITGDDARDAGPSELPGSGSGSEQLQTSSAVAARAIKMRLPVIPMAVSWSLCAVQGLTALQPSSRPLDAAAPPAAPSGGRDSTVSLSAPTPVACEVTAVDAGARLGHGSDAVAAADAAVSTCDEPPLTRAELLQLRRVLIAAISVRLKSWLPLPTVPALPELDPDIAHRRAQVARAAARQPHARALALVPVSFILTQSVMNRALVTSLKAAGSGRVHNMIAATLNAAAYAEDAASVAALMRPLWVWLLDTFYANVHVLTAQYAIQRPWDLGARSVAETVGRARTCPATRAALDVRVDQLANTDYLLGALVGLWQPLDRALVLSTAMQYWSLYVASVGHGLVKPLPVRSGASPATADTGLMQRNANAPARGRDGNKLRLADALNRSFAAGGGVSADGSVTGSGLLPEPPSLCPTWLARVLVAVNESATRGGFLDRFPGLHDTFKERNGRARSGFEHVVLQRVQDLCAAASTASRSPSSSAGDAGDAGDSGGANNAANDERGRSSSSSKSSVGPRASASAHLQVRPHASWIEPSLGTELDIAWPRQKVAICVDGPYHFLVPPLETQAAADVAFRRSLWWSKPEALHYNTVVIPAELALEIDGPQLAKLRAEAADAEAAGVPPPQRYWDGPLKPVDALRRNALRACGWLVVGLGSHIIDMHWQRTQDKGKVLSWAGSSSDALLLRSLEAQGLWDGLGLPPPPPDAVNASRMGALAVSKDLRRSATAADAATADVVAPGATAPAVPPAIPPAISSSAVSESVVPVAVVADDDSQGRELATAASPVPAQPALSAAVDGETSQPQSDAVVKLAGAAGQSNTVNSDASAVTGPHAAVDSGPGQTEVEAKQAGVSGSSVLDTDSDEAPAWPAPGGSRTPASPRGGRLLRVGPLIAQAMRVANEAGMRDRNLATASGSLASAAAPTSAAGTASQPALLSDPVARARLVDLALDAPDGNTEPGNTTPAATPPDGAAGRALEGDSEAAAPEQIPAVRRRPNRRAWGSVPTPQGAEPRLNRRVRDSVYSLQALESRFSRKT